MTGVYRLFPNRYIRAGRRRRYDARRFRILLIAAAAFVLIFTGVLCHGQVIRASDSCETTVRYRSIEVAEGDTLWEIAGEYGGGQDRASCIREIRRMNHLHDDTIHAGAYLVVPCPENLSAAK